MKQKQQGIAVPNSYIVKPDKSFIPDKFNNQMELKKINRIKYSTKALLELRDWGFSEEDVSRCANITDVVEKLIVWNESLPTYRGGEAVYI